MKGSGKRNPVNVVSALLALIFVLAGLAKLTGTDIVIERFQAWGYPTALAKVVGLVEILGGLALLYPPFASLGALALSLVMVGAIATHIAYGAAAFAVVPLVLLVGLVWIAGRRLHEPVRWTLSWRKDLA
jgi:uncharacterized membrane protein YphA (DoxX/SURF4 family)